MSAFVTVAFALVLGQTAAPKNERPRHPLAPSMPILTDEENTRYEAIINRFIDYDIGKLPKSQGEKAKADFQRLPADSIFMLIEGFNRAAKMEDSCPAVVIGRKIALILKSTDDVDLLNFAKDNIGLGVKARRHMGTIKDLQLTCIIQKGNLQRQRLASAGGSRPGPAPANLTAIPALTQADFIAGAKNEQGPKLKAILAEADKRKLFDVLVIAAARPETEAHDIGQSYLDKHLEQKSAAQLKDLLKHAKPEARAASAKAIGQRGLHFEKDLIDRLGDEATVVRQAARHALVKLSGGEDFGPSPEANQVQQVESMQLWREWLSKAKK
jgi:hypothetical protein